MSSRGSSSSFIQALQGNQPYIPPMWFMRQAGRYLPEYRAVREKFPSFIDFCFASDAATEVTLQPITRFDLDAAIIFADILTIPHALGHTVTFTEGFGPKVEPIINPSQIDTLKTLLTTIPEKLAPIAHTVKQTQQELPEDKAVIGFSGAPWTLATYMLDEKPSQSVTRTISFASEHPEAFASLIETLTQGIITYLSMQIEAGANAVQLFDSWAGSCQPCLWNVAVHHPLLTISRELKKKYPEIPTILFPRLATEKQMVALATEEEKGFAALSLSTEMSMEWASKNLQPHVAIQGNLDPLLLTNPNPKTIEEPALTMLKMATKNSGKGYVVNLGHGLTPETNIETLHRLVSLIREGSYKV